MRPARSLAGLALGAALVALPGAGLVARAADSPTAAVDGILDALEAKDFAGVGPFICAERREDALASLDVSASLGELPPGVDGAAFMDALTISLDGRSTTLVEETGDTAVVALAGTMRIAIDEAVAEEFVRSVLEASGQPATDEMVGMMLPMLMELFAEGTDMSAELDVIREDGGWVVCDDDLVDGGSTEPDPLPSMAPAAGPLCGIVDLAALGAATGYAFTEAMDLDGGCSIASEYGEDGSFASVDFRIDTSIGMDIIREVYTPGEEATIAGLTAWVSDLGTFLDLGDGRVLAISPFLYAGDAEPDAETIRAFVTQVAELVVPLLPAA